MDYQRQQWEALIRSLDEWSSDRELDAGRIHVRLPEKSREVIIEMTPDEWDDMSGVMWGSFEDALNDIKQTLLGLNAREQYAQYSDYRLYGSEVARPSTVAEGREEVTPAGEWLAVNRDGRVSRFADWPEPDEDEK
jgi:hypothetical protein